MRHWGNSCEMIVQVCRKSRAYSYDPGPARSICTVPENITYTIGGDSWPELDLFSNGGSASRMVVKMAVVSIFPCLDRVKVGRNTLLTSSTYIGPGGVDQYRDQDPNALQDHTVLPVPSSVVRYKDHG